MVRARPRDGSHSNAVHRHAVLSASVALVLLLGMATPVGVAADSTARPSSTCGGSDVPPARPPATGNDSNVSVSVWTAPGATFGAVQNAGQLHAALDSGWVTPAGAGATEDVARRDVVALRVNVSGDARAVLDDVAAANATTPEGRFVDRLGDQEIRDEGFDLALRTGMCGLRIDWARTADQGALNVVVDRANASLYVAIDQDDAVFANNDGWGGGARIWVQEPGATEPRAAGYVDHQPRDLTLGEDDRSELPASEGARLTGTTTVAPGTRLKFYVSAIVGNFTSRVEARVARDGSFAAALNLSSVSSGTVLDVYPADEEISLAKVTAGAPQTPTPTASPTPTRTSTPASTSAPASSSTPTPSPPSIRSPTPIHTRTSAAIPTSTTVPGVGTLAALVALLVAAVEATIRVVSNDVR